MPQAILVPALTYGLPALGLVGGAAISARASNKATDASSKANKEALDYTKEQEAARRADFAQAQQAYQRQWEAWNAQRMALLGRYGVDVSGMQAPPMQQQAAPGTYTGSATQGFVGSRGTDPRAANAAGAATQGGQTVADILGRGQNLGKWNDWSANGIPTA